MSHLSRVGRSGLFVLLCLLLPSTAWAGHFDGLGAAIMGVIVGIPMAGIMLIFIIILIAFLAGNKRSRAARIFARVVQSLAIIFQILFMLITFGVEHNSAGLAIGGASSTGLLLFTCAGFVLGQVLAVKCRSAEAARLQESIEGVKAA